MSKSYPVGPVPSPGSYLLHQYGEPDADRQAKNRQNAALYFQLTTGARILQIAAGDFPYPGALSEDVNQYTDKRQPKLLALVGEQLDTFLPADSWFDRVVVINARNCLRRNLDYQWVFDVAGPVVAVGGTIVIAGVDDQQPSIQWATTNESTISSLGFTKVSPLGAGATEPAESAIRALPGGTFGGPLGGMVMYSNANAVQVVWQKN